MKRYAILGMLSLVLLAGCGRQPAAANKNPGNTSAATPPASDAGSHQSAPAFPARVSDAGRVVIEVRPLNLDRPEGTLHFQVAMNTHSVELNYDLTRLAVLRTDRGDEVTPLQWDGEQGGHHLNGTLYFPAVDLKDAQWAEMVIRDVAGVPERTFRWELTP
ncbi:MAG: hypothetical protein ACE5F6_21590 [Anaerolineae bacterium]